jgi:hypothetical protein
LCAADDILETAKPPGVLTTQEASKSQPERELQIMSGFSLPQSFVDAASQNGGNTTLHERIAPVTYTCVDDDILWLHADTKDFAARVLCYLTTRPMPWTMSEGAIAAKFGVDTKKVKRAISWLTAQGYCRTRRRKVRHGIFEDGRVSSNVYVWDWYIYEVPRMNPDFVKRQQIAG